MSADGSFDATALPAALPASPAPAPPAVASPAASATSTVTASASTAASGVAAAGGGGEGGAQEEQRGLPGNGGSTDRYTWTQTLDDLQVSFTLPPGTRAKDVQCEIKARAVKASRARLQQALLA